MQDLGSTPPEGGAESLQQNPKHVDDYFLAANRKLDPWYIELSTEEFFNKLLPYTSQPLSADKWAKAYHQAAVSLNQVPDVEENQEQLLYEPLVNQPWPVYVCTLIQSFAVLGVSTAISGCRPDGVVNEDSCV